MNTPFIKKLCFSLTGTKTSPWVVIKGNDKDKARKEATRYILDNIPYEQKGMTNERLSPDPVIVNIKINAI